MLDLNSPLRNADYLDRQILRSAHPSNPFNRLVVVTVRRLDVLAQPPNTLAVSLPHDNTAHEDLDGPDALKRSLALTGCLVQAERRTELILRDRVWVVDLVAENDEWGVLKLLHREKGVELGF